MNSSPSNSCGGSTQPLADILPWGSPLSAASSQKGDHSATNASHHCTSRTVLITDSLSTDARFLLHTLAIQFLSSKSLAQDPSSSSSNYHLSGSVLWISCGSPPVTEKQIGVSLRKAIQHGLGTSYGDSGIGSSASNLGSVNVVSIPIELADAALQSDSKLDMSHESYLKRLHRRTVHWLQHRELLSDKKILDMTKPQSNKSGEQQTGQGPNLIIIDGVTTLASLFGDALCQMFVSSVHASLKCFTRKSSIDRNESKALTAITNLLAIRCTTPDDGGLYNITDLNESEYSGNTNRSKGQKLRSEYSRLLRPWLGVGSTGSVDSQIFHLEEQSHCLSLQTQSSASLLYKSSWYELADAIVDVSPLESGYARDVLGRLSFATTWGGLGWWGVSHSNMKNRGTSFDSNAQGGYYGSNCVNYCIDDGGVKIMRLRSGK